MPRRAATLAFLLVSTAALATWSVPNSVLHLNQIADASTAVDVVVPRRLPSRRRRDAHATPPLLVNDWILDTEPNGDLFGEDGLTTEWVTDDGVRRERYDERCTMGRGVVRGESDSLVAITECEGVVTGLIHVKGDDFFIEPVRGGSGVGAHLLYKAKRAMLQGGDVVDAGGVRVKRESYLTRGATTGHPDWVHEIVEGGGNGTGGRERRRKYEEDDEFGYFVDTAWEQEPVVARGKAMTWTPQRWLELAIAVDHSVIAFHGKERAQQYVLALMNIVSAIYKDPSLGSNMKLAIVRMVFYEDKKHGEVRAGNSKRSLENVNRWNARSTRALDAAAARHDAAVWLTRIDLGGPSGYAPVAGACDPARSCALNRDEGLTSSFIIAHELAHVLGLSHDGDKDTGNACGIEAALGSVMAPMVSATFHRFTWSTCSRAEFAAKTAAWQCLSNAPAKSANATHLKATLQATFSMDEQCRMEFGDGYSLCRSFDLPEPCSHLWCGHFDTPLVCKTKKGPPLEGTACGTQRWCIGGGCESLASLAPGDGRRPALDPVTQNPREGGWSPWAGWTKCSRPCGAGVSFRVRRCDAPRPAYGGDNCVGRSEEFRICNHRDCPEPLTDFRAQQCLRMPTIGPLIGSLGHRANQTWLPHEAEQRSLKCQLTCSSLETGGVFLTGENLVDGTRCSYDDDDDICIQGECQRLGCDGALDSTLGRDACGVCAGNGSTCHTVAAAFNKTLRRAVTRIAVLPRLARDILIVANTTLPSGPPDISPVKMWLRDRRGRVFELLAPEQRHAAAPHRTAREAHAAAVVAGAGFRYRRSGGREELRARGPLLAEIVVSVTAEGFGAGPSPAVSASVTFVLPEGVPRGRYAWQRGGWGPCSASCGGGRRVQTLACRDARDNKVVRRALCSLLVKPPTRQQVCNAFGCEVRWTAAAWEHCSTSCGPSGWQQRQVFCSANETDEFTQFVDPELCPAGGKPAESRPCNRLPCPANWRPGNWSECSSVCGRGFESRPHVCPAAASECGVAPPPERRPCVGGGRRGVEPCVAPPPPAECRRDASKYCRLLGLLGRYCVVPGYRRLCCLACSRRDNQLPEGDAF